MALSRSFWGWIFALVLTSATTLAAVAGPTPAEILLRSMQRQTGVNVIGIIEQRDGGGTGVSQTIRVERDRHGRAHYLVLAPLRMQGIESVDDGFRSRMYWPDRNVLIDQESPSKTPCDAAWRIALTKKNYRLRFVTPIKIAGRATKCIEAVPLDNRMETRRFYLDASTFYPLRLETYEGNRRISKISDTKEISYPDAVPEDRFVLSPAGSTRTLRYNRPQSLKLSQAEKLIGFTPLLPKEMPMGFAMQDIQLTQSDKWRSVAIRVTDGLVRGTVYQWRSRRGEPDVEGMDDNSVVQVGDIKMMMVSDLDANRRRAMLEAFIESALADGTPEGLLDLRISRAEPDSIFPALDSLPIRPGSGPAVYRCIQIQIIFATADSEPSPLKRPDQSN